MVCVNPVQKTNTPPFRVEISDWLAAPLYFNPLLVEVSAATELPYARIIV